MSDYPDAEDVEWMNAPLGPPSRDERVEELRALGPEHLAAKKEQLADLIGRDAFGRLFERPWCCPEPRCLPVWQVRDSNSKPLGEAQPGQSFGCWGRLGRTVEFAYDGVPHTNDLKSCFYSALKGVVSWQENIEDWTLLADAYHMAELRMRSGNRVATAGRPNENQG